MSNEYKERIELLRGAYNKLYSDEERRCGRKHWKNSAELTLLSERHICHCAETVAAAYHAGDHEHMWEAFAEAARENHDSHGNLVNNIMRETITQLQWGRAPINSDALGRAMFERMVSDACVGIDITPLSKLLRLLAEQDDTWAGLTRDNSEAIAGKIAHILHEDVLPVDAYAVVGLERRLPYTNHHYITQYVLGAARGADADALTELGKLALTEEAKPGHVINYARKHSPAPEATQEMVDAAAWWRSEITRAEQAGDGESVLFARYAHAHAALTLLHGGALPADDLAALIDSLQIEEEAGDRRAGIRLATLDWERYYFRLTTVNNIVGDIVDLAAGRMIV